MRTAPSALLWPLLLLLLPLTARADDAPSPEVQAFLKAWSAKMEGVKTLRVSFTQTKTLRILRRPLVSAGTAWLVGTRVRMVIRNKDGQPETELVVGGGQAQIHYPRLKRLEVFTLADDAAPSTPFPLFGADLEELPKTYRIRLETADGATLLVLQPRAQGSPLKETRMRLVDYEVREVVQVSHKGDRVELKVTAFERNPPLTDEDVALKVAAGTKTVTMGTPPKQGE